MKLKIDYIQDIIDDLRSACADSANKKHIIFKYNGCRLENVKCRTYYCSNENTYIASKIQGLILPHITEIQSESFLELYVIKTYSLMSHYGFYLGIPYCKTDKPDIKAAIEKVDFAKDLYDKDFGDITELFNLLARKTKTKDYIINRNIDTRLNELCLENPIIKIVGLGA